MLESMLPQKLPRRKFALRFFLLLCLSALSGCSSLQYYGQAIAGHIDVLNRRQPIARVIANSDDTVLKKRLQTVQTARAFASRELALPNNASYRTYADLERDYVVWNVFAAPELALKPLQACFFLVGCLSYRGFFSQKDAQRNAEQLRQQDYDVYVGGVNAYSSLGWFDDPVLNTMLKHSDIYLVGLIFHELAHQQLYIKDDSMFNESFASAVEHAGLERWLAQSGDEDLQQRYHTWQQRKATFNARVLATAENLQMLYAQDLPEAEKRQRKRAELDKLRAYYEHADPHEMAYKNWLADVNNAKLLTVQTYHDYVPAFLRLLADNAGNFAAFYQQVEALSQLSQTERNAALSDLSREAKDQEI
jgi:predicted aminopeptidase